MLLCNVICFEPHVCGEISRLRMAHATNLVFS